MDETQTFGELLREQRLAVGVSQITVGAAVGVTRAYVCMVEKGRAKPFTPTQILRLAARLGTPPDALLLASARSRGSLRLATPTSELGLQLLVTLAGAGTAWTDADYRDAVMRVLESRARDGLVGSVELAVDEVTGEEYWRRRPAPPEES